MFKFKLFLFMLILPLSYFLYHITSFDNGINALLEKKKHLMFLQSEQKHLLSEIKKVKNKLDLLSSYNPDLDLLEEISFEILGNSDKESFHINLNNL